MEKSWDFRLGPETDIVIEFVATHRASYSRGAMAFDTEDTRTSLMEVLRFEATVAGWQEVGWWVMSWGEEAEVIEPRELREWVAETAAEKMVRVYQKD